MDIISHIPDHAATTIRSYVNRVHPEGIDARESHHAAGHPDLDGYRVDVAWSVIVDATDRATHAGEFSADEVEDLGRGPNPELDALIDELAARVIGCGCANEVCYRAVETNAGTIEVSDGRTAWGMGPGYDKSALPADMAAWVAGDWQPREADGLVLIPLHEFDRTYRASDFVPLDPATGRPLA